MSSIKTVCIYILYVGIHIYVCTYCIRIYTFIHKMNICTNRIMKVDDILSDSVPTLSDIIKEMVTTYKSNEGLRGK